MTQKTTSTHSLSRIEGSYHVTIGAIVLAAGKGTRMKSSLPKVLHPIAGLPMIDYVLNGLLDAGIYHRLVVVGDQHDDIVRHVFPIPCVVQSPQNGTGHAVAIAEKAYSQMWAEDQAKQTRKSEDTGSGHTGLNCTLPDYTLPDYTLIVFGDTPFVTSSTIRDISAMVSKPEAPGMVVIAFQTEQPQSYGRLILGHNNKVQKIIEHKDANDAERQIRLCNSGMMIVKTDLLFAQLPHIQPSPVTGEVYLTDLVRLMNVNNQSVEVVIIPESQVMGVNSMAELAVAEAVQQCQLRNRAMDQGVTMIDPSTVYLSWDTAFGNQVVIEPHVVFGPGVRIDDGVRIRAFCYLEGATIDQGCVVGPFARLREGTVLNENAKIGNFVETKKTTVGKGSKINHLSYIGDAILGQNVNVGAGTITCNYDGVNKAVTQMEDQCFIGSNTSLVAPVTIGQQAIIGAGSVITKDVEAFALAVERSEQRTVSGWSKRRNQFKKSK